MEDGRSPTSALKGRLADVFVPALVSGTIDALTRRLGNRATVDDPVHGRAASLSAIEALLSRFAASLAERGAVYTHLRTTTGFDRDACEGSIAVNVAGAPRVLPIAVVAERRRLREIELRVYYMPSVAGHEARTEPPSSRAPRASIFAPPLEENTAPPMAKQIGDLLAAMRSGSVERVLAAFESNARVVGPDGRAHERHDGAMATLFADLGPLELSLGGYADDGRTACVETAVTRRGHDPMPALFSMKRGESGLLRELRVYWE